MTIGKYAVASDQVTSPKMTNQLTWTATSIPRIVNSRRPPPRPPLVARSALVVIG
jgi:hypothetical protein